MPLNRAIFWALAIISFMMAPTTSGFAEKREYPKAVKKDKSHKNNIPAPYKKNQDSNLPFDQPLQNKNNNGLASGTPFDTHTKELFRSGHQDGSENIIVHGKGATPPGYIPAPSVTIQNGPDPGHLQRRRRDPITGSDTTNFGSAYEENSPIRQGKLGDATGNGWVAPRQ